MKTSRRELCFCSRRRADEDERNMQRNRLSSFQFGALVKFVSRCRFGHTVASHVSLEDFVIRLMSIVSQEPALKKRKKLSTSRFPRWEKVIRKFASRCGSIVLIDLLSFFYFEERKKTPISRSLRGRRSCMATPTESDLFFALFAHRDRCSLNVRSVTYPPPPPPSLHPPAAPPGTLATAPESQIDFTVAEEEE